MGISRSAVANMLFAAGVVGVMLSGRGSAHAAVPATFHRDISRILQQHCQDCHRPGQVAPFALLTYEQAKKRGPDLVRATSERIMPPWPASTSYGGPFHDQRVLDPAAIAAIRTWVEGGCPEGDASEAPPPREFRDEWPLGPPDVVLTMPATYEIPEAGADQFRVFVLKTDLPETKWIRAVDYRPGNRKVVHHMIAAIDTSGRGRELDAADPKPGYEAVGGFGDGVPIRGFLPVWTPGARPRFAPEGAGYVLPARADVLIQMHYHPSGKPETDTTEVGLYLADKPLAKQLRTGFVFPDIPLAQQIKLAAKFKAAEASGRRPSFDEMLEDVVVIPADEPHYAVQGSTKAGLMMRPFSRNVILTSVMPHMHWLGKDFEMDAVLPDEQHTRIPLIKIDRWDFNWQGTYALARPISLPKGSYLEMRAHFDNSAGNPANPSHPPRLVHWGEQTTNEMCIGIFEFVAAEQPASSPTPKPTDPASPRPTGG